MNEKGAARSGAADDAAERGLTEILTAEGLAKYLALVALLPDGVAESFADSPWAVWNDRDAIGLPGWNAYRDRYAYCGMLGAWTASGEADSPQTVRQRLFGFEVPVLRVAPSARDARHIVNEIVRQEFQAFAISSEDANFGRFLQACFSVLGHIMTGTMDAAYFRQVAAAQQACTAAADPNLHELLRKQSIFLRDALEERASRTRRTTMRNVLTEIEHLR